MLKEINDFVKETKKFRSVSGINVYDSFSIRTKDHLKQTNTPKKEWKGNRYYRREGILHGLGVGSDIEVFHLECSQALKGLQPSAIWQGNVVSEANK